MLELLVAAKRPTRAQNKRLLDSPTPFIQYVEERLSCRTRVYIGIQKSWDQGDQLYIPAKRLAYYMRHVLVLGD